MLQYVVNASLLFVLGGFVPYEAYQETGRINSGYGSPRVY
jgi:hypothetical protein